MYTLRSIKFQRTAPTKVPTADSEGYQVDWSWSVILDRLVSDVPTRSRALRQSIWTGGASGKQIATMSSNFTTAARGMAHTAQIDCQRSTLVVNAVFAPLMCHQKSAPGLTAGLSFPEIGRLRKIQCTSTVIVLLRGDLITKNHR